MAFHREISKALMTLQTRQQPKILGHVQRKFAPPPLRDSTTISEKSLSAFSDFFEKNVSLNFFKYITAPFERWQYASSTKFLRDHGLMYDDLYPTSEPIVERAVSFLPEDMATARYRRMMRGYYLSYLRLYLPIEEQNYDPYIPYLAPFIEEAKFQIQEELELLGFHPHDRRLFVGGTSGFGDTEPGLHFLTCLPNLYGAASGNMKQRH